MISDPLIRLLADLVAIPSVNPMGRGKAGPGYREQEVAAFVAAYLRAHGVDTSVSDVAPGRPNVTGFVDAGAGKTLLLESHSDTVLADSMSIPPFTPEIRNGRLYGRGACDTKGSLAVFMHGVCSLLASGGKFRHNVVILVAADEEYRFTGALQAVQQGLKADFGIVGEPTLLRVVRAHKGVTRWRIVSRGIAAHSAYPERGENAIYAMGHLLGRLETYGNALRRTAPHALLGAPSLSAGVIEGGEAVNIVPDRCTVEVDRRTLPGERAEDVLRGVARALEGLEGWEFEPPYLSVGGMDVPEESTVVRLLSGAIAGTRGEVHVESAQYATDAGIYNGAGIPSVVFGPGDIAQAHTSEEWIDLDNLHAAAAVVRSLLSGS
ncbi:MAG TPA: M20 family metallopeptidase [Bacteroidota bacterium]|nr:M20 family metallopeptidase [Bacteroidota bacterium]